MDVIPGKALSGPIRPKSKFSRERQPWLDSGGRKRYKVGMPDSHPCCPIMEQLPLGRIYTSPHQMRRHFCPVALEDLARSMKHEGLMQPITVRKVGDAYELVVGERRLRAARMLGWKTMDCRVIDVSDEEAAVKG